MLGPSAWGLAMEAMRRCGESTFPRVRRSVSLLALLALPAFAAWAEAPLQILQPSHLSSLEPTPVKVQVPPDLTGPVAYTLTLSDEEDQVHRVLHGTLSPDEGSRAATVWVQPTDLAAFSLGEPVVLALAAGTANASAEATVLPEPATTEASSWAITFSGRPAQVYTTQDSALSLQATNPKTSAKSTQIKVMFLNAKGQKKATAATSALLPPGPSGQSVGIPASLATTAKQGTCTQAKAVLVVGGVVKATETVPVDYDLAGEASASPTSGMTPLAVTFSGSASGGTPPFSFAWDFGDGGSATGDSPSHTYLHAGTFNWTLAVTDSVNGTVGGAGAVTVAPRPHRSLSVSVGAGSSGTPAAGTYDHLEGDTVPYAYSVADCYEGLAVTLDGTPVPSSGTVLMNADHALAVTASLKTFTVTATAGAGGTVSPPGVTTLNCGASQGYTITANYGFHIEDVQVDGVSAGAIGTYTFTGVVANHTLSATFSPTPTQTLAVSLGTGISGTPAATASYPRGTSVNYAYTAAACYGSLAVTLDGTPVPSSGTVLMNADHALAVTASLKTFTVTATAGAGGTVSPPGVTTLNCGSSQSYTITADSGFHVLDVQVDGVSVGGVGTYTFTGVAANHTLSATFTLNPIQTLTVSLGPGTSGTPAATASYPLGTVVDYAYAIGDDCYQDLVVLLDGVSTAASGTVTMNANHTLAVSASLKSFTIDASADRGGTISPAGRTTVPCGGSQTYTMTPLAFYQVADVKVDGVSVGAPSTYTFSDVRGNHTIAATFSLAAAHTLSVTLGEGVTGSPSVTTKYLEGATVNYAYALADSCHQSLAVTLDGIPASASGTITMDKNHKLSVTALSVAYLLSVDLAAGTSGTPAGTTVYACNQSVNYSYGVLAGYKDFAVTLDDNPAPSSGTILMNQNHHLATSATRITFTITASVSGGTGTVTPSGSVIVPYGGSQFFAFTPGTGFQVWDVLVDGTSVGRPNNYTFNDVLSNHTLQVFFRSPLSVGCLASPPVGVAPLTTSFTALPQGGQPEGYTYSWDFGDGGTSTEQNPSHQYVSIGDYTATVTLTDGVQTAQCQTNVSATVDHDPSVVNLVATPSTVTLGTTSLITFTLTDPDANDLINWTATLTQTPTNLGTLSAFSGGPVSSGGGQNVTYIPFEACPAGSCTATVQITATDSYGGTSSQSVTVTVN
jgi:PKD repeat protein